MSHTSDWLLEIVVAFRRLGVYSCLNSRLREKSQIGEWMINIRPMPPVGHAELKKAVLGGALAVP